LGGVDAVLFPLIGGAEAGALVRDVLPALDPDGIELRHRPRRALGRAIRRSVWPWLVVAALVAWAAGPWGALALAVTPFAALLGWARFRAAAVGLEDRRLAVSSRRLGRRRIVADARAVQWRTLRASPFQRRRGLATLAVGLATGGEESVRDLDTGDAGRLAGALDPRRLPLGRPGVSITRP
jgi:putative membrane protein